MSSQLPPPPAGPAGPAGFGSPLQTGPPLPPGGGPAKTRSPLPWIIGAVLAVAAVIVVILLVAGGGGGSSVDAEGASAGLAAVLDDADFEESSISDLRDCPLGDQAELTEQIADDIDASDELLDGDTEQYVFEPDDDPPVLFCGISSEEFEESVSYIALQPPGGEYSDFIEDFFAAGSDELEIEDPVDFVDAVIYAYCAGSDGDEGCGAHWVDEDDDIVIGIGFSGERATPADAEAALRTILGDMADGLAAEA